MSHSIIRSVPILDVTLQLGVSHNRYVSRVHPNHPKPHQILSFQKVKPAELAQQMTLDVGNAWGILHAILDTCMGQPEGKYVILKDPNQVRD